MKRLGVIVLAAGLSRRMGPDNKLLLPINCLPMYHHITEAVDKAADCLQRSGKAMLPTAITAKILVTACREIKVAMAKRNDWQVVENPHPEYGMAESIKRGIMALPKVDGVLFASADQPFLTAEVLLTLLREFATGDKIIVPAINGEPTNPCVFPRRFMEEFFTLTGDCGGKKIYRQHLAETSFVQFSEAVRFLDLDTPEAIEKARKQMEGMPCTQSTNM